MTSISDSHHGLPGSGTIVNYDEPVMKPPPLLAVGPLAWIRNNLFRSTMDTLLTLAFAALGVSVLSGIIAWAIQQANWFTITENLRMFLVGRFPIDQLWRIEWIAFYILFVSGFALATWTRISRGLVLTIAVALVLMFVIPPVVDSVAPPPTAALAVGSTPIQSGTVTETPLSTVGFIGSAGTEISITYPETLTSDTTLADIAAFTDRATAALVNSARNRLAAQAEVTRVEARLASDTLTEGQREALNDELASLDVPPSVSESVELNQTPIRVQVLDAGTLDVVAEAVLPTETRTLSFVLPENGWYLLNKTAETDTSITILEIDNLEPLLVSELSARDRRFRTLVTDFETDEAQPRDDAGQDLPIINIIDYQFSGERSLAQFLRLQAAPFLDQINVALLALTVAAVAGYSTSRILERTRPPSCPDGQRSNRGLSTLVLISPIVIALLLAAVDTSRWGGLLLTFVLTAVGIVLSFPIGVLLALGRRSHYPIVKMACVFFIEVVRGVPLITVLFIANLMLPLLHPSLATVEGIFRAMAGITLFSAAYLAENVRGGLQSIPPGQEEAARALGLSSIQVILFIMLPQALRAVIPALVGQAISLFKDTSLVAIIGLFDLTRIADSVIVQPEFIGARPEAYLFISIIYFLFSYLMAWASRKVEASGSGAARKF
jgi:His/Glu/Gln/Arg/opine family amino acid ABC transporter permease subunit